MNSYIVMYNSNSNNLLGEYETIVGKTAKEALEKHFCKQYKRLTGDDARYADVILVKGTFSNNNIHPGGRFQRLCYGIIN